jgi:small subunit ribosomal protein S18
MSEEQKPQAAGEERGPRQPMAKDKDAAAGVGEQRFRAKRRRKVSYLTINKIEYVDYKDVPVLRRFINERGKILPSRQTGNTAKQQRMIARAIRRAREMALLPFVVTEMTADRREYQRRDRRAPRDDQRNAEPREAAPVAEAPVAAPVVETPVAETPAAAE